MPLRLDDPLGLGTASDGNIIAVNNRRLRQLLNSGDPFGQYVLKSLVDAKGDLIVGTANDTVARKAVGANDTALIADSAQSDGLVWGSVLRPTIVDAKGDLIVGTAADTAARKAVGANGTMLVADSAQSDGLKWVETAGTALPSSPVNGQRHQLRVGSTPFDFIQLVYDGTYGRWVSSTFDTGSQNQASITEMATTYGALNATAMDYVHVFAYDATYAAGLRLQGRLAGRLTNSAASQTSARLAVYEWNEADASPTFLEGVAVIAEQAGAGTSEMRDSGWDFFVTDPAEAHARVTVETKVTGGTGTYDDLAFQLRWASV